MSAITRVEQLGSRYIERHWLLTIETVKEIFKGDLSRVFQLRKDLEKKSQLEQLLLYHDCPLIVAANLCGVSGRKVSKCIAAYHILERKLLAEEILAFLRSRKGPVKYIWMMRNIFGSHYDMSMPRSAEYDLFKANKVKWVGDARIGCS